MPWSVRGGIKQIQLGPRDRRLNAPKNGALPVPKRCMTA